MWFNTSRFIVFRLFEMLTTGGGSRYSPLLSVVPYFSEKIPCSEKSLSQTPDKPKNRLFLKTAHFPKYSQDPVFNRRLLSVPLNSPCKMRNVTRKTFLCVVVVEVIEFLGNGSNLFHTVLVSGEIRFESLVFFNQSLKLRQIARSVVFCTKSFVLS